MGKLSRLHLVVLLVCLIHIVVLREEEEEVVRISAGRTRPGGKKQRLRQCVLDTKRGAFLETIPKLSEGEFKSKFNLSRDEVEEVLGQPHVRATLTSRKFSMSALEHMYALLIYLKEGCSLDLLAWDMGVNTSVLERSLARTSKVLTTIVR